MPAGTPAVPTEVLRNLKPVADFWHGRFAAPAQHNAGAGTAMYRSCLRCGGQALEGALSAHARWCDKQAIKAMTLAAFDDLTRVDRRQFVNRRDEVRAAAKAAA